MRLCRIQLQGIKTAFDSPMSGVQIDFESLGDGLIALVGSNGSGKTTIMSAAPVALYRCFPSRPGFYENFSGRDALVRCIFSDDGRELDVTLNIDAERRRTEKHIRLDGVPFDEDFDRAVALNFGSKDLFLASVFASQDKTGNFLRLPKAQRKALFCELLGQGRLDELCELARQRLRDAETRVLELQGSAKQLLVDVSDLSESTLYLPQAEAALESATESLERQKERLEAARAELERVRSSKLIVERAREADDAARRDASAAKERLDAVIACETHARELYGERTMALRAEINSADSEKIDLEYQESARKLEDERAAERKKADQLPAIDAAKKKLAELLDEGKEISAAEHRTVLLEEAVSRAKERVDIERQHRDAAAKKREGERERLLKLRATRGSAPCTKSDGWRSHDLKADPFVDLAGSCPLLAHTADVDERLSELDADDDQERDAVREAEREFARAVERVDADVHEHRQRQKRLGEIDAEEAEAQLRVAREDICSDAVERLSELQEERVKLDKEYDEKIQSASRLRGVAAEKLTQLEANLTAELAVIQDRKLRAERQLEEKDAALAATQSALAAALTSAEALSLKKAQDEYDAASGDVTDAEDNVAHARDSVAALKERVELYQKKKAHAEQLAEKIEEKQIDLDDWQLLVKALGKDGIQALEIDAAGPEIAELTNHLLEVCADGRFSISFETLKEKRGGGQKEVFDVHVFNRGIETSVESLSGGEQVIVGEAIGLAMSIYNAKKSGVRWETLFRDETAGALDAEAAQAYISMLRRALSLGGFRQVIFVSHTQDVYSAADAQLLVGGGAVRVQSAA